MADKALNRAHNFLAVTPSDSVYIVPLINEAGGAPTTGLYIGGTGDVTCLNASGAAILFKAVPVGTTLYIETQRVNATGTTATNIVALF